MANKEQFRLADEGTLDTVIECILCGKREAYNYATSVEADEGMDYESFIAVIIESLELEHYCGE
jgi:hypothetical protein